jgi:hypothetical protein
MPLGDPDPAGPKPTDLQWLDGRLRICFEQAEIEVFSAGWSMSGSVRIRITHDGSYKDLTVPLGMLANRDWDRLIAHWREEQTAKPWIVAPKKLYQPGVVRRVAPPLRKGQVIH